MTPNLLPYSFLNQYNFFPNSVIAFSTKRNGGGVSTGAYATFNANGYCGDSEANVKENRAILCNALLIPQENLIIPHQNHGTEVRLIDNSFMSLSPEAKAQHLEGVDALISNTKGICICISTADCVPILIYDESSNAFAAIHAGWRGTQKRILSTAINTMKESFGSNTSRLKAIIGPSISLDSFEVGEEVYNSFQKASFDMNSIARKMPDMRGGTEYKWHIDLWKANSMIMQEEGVPQDNIYISNICTYKSHGEYFSARRLGTNSGRILSGIMIP